MNRPAPNPPAPPAAITHAATRRTNAYPRLKVFLWFLLCPFFGGVLAWLYAVTLTEFPVEREASQDLVSIFSFYIWLPIVMGLLAVCLYLIPAAVPALAYVLLKPRRTIWACAAITLIGSGVAYAWSSWIGLLHVSIFQTWLFFLAGGASSLIAAWMALPAQKSPMQP